MRGKTTWKTKRKVDGKVVVRTSPSPATLSRTFNDGSFVTTIIRKRPKLDAVAIAERQKFAPEALERDDEVTVAHDEAYIQIRMKNGSLMFDMMADTNENPNEKFVKFDSGGKYEPKIFLFGAVTMPKTFVDDDGDACIDPKSDGRVLLARVRGVKKRKRCTKETDKSCQARTKVPSFRVGDKWQTLARDAPDKFRRLVVGENDIVSSLFAKFELERFIHVFAEPPSSGDALLLIYCLPRFKLEFKSQGSDVVSMDWINCRWKLHAEQCLPDTLLGLSCCLVLTCEEEGRTRLVVPTGEITRGSRDEVLVFRSEDICADLEYFTYDRHLRDHHLLAPTLSSRLHLAGLYSAAFRAGNDPCNGKPAVNVAVELIRQYWTTSQMSEVDWRKHTNVSRLTRINCPALHILCSRNVDWQRRLEFLYPARDIMDWDSLAADPAAFKYYEQTKPQSFCAMSPSAPLLLDYEEKDMFGRVSEPRAFSVCMTTPWETVEPDSPPPWELEFVRGVEKDLLQCLIFARPPTATFPIVLTNPDHWLHRNVHDELLLSFERYQKTPGYTVDTGKCRALLQEGELQLTVSREISNAKSWIEAAFALLPVHPRLRAVFRLRHTVGDIRKPTWRDLLRLAVAENTEIHVFNPFLSPGACESIRQGIRSWLMLIVLEDKLKRLGRILDSGGADELIVKELECVRVWDVNQYPQWLVFEVEQELQIRPLQAHFAQYLLGNPSKIGQLQVGEGKTRVILPALVFASSDIMRVNFLPQLHGEATAFLSFALGSSVLSRPVFTLPFNRDADVGSPLNVQTLGALVDLIRDSRGVLSVTPQNVLSIPELEASRVDG